MTREELREYNVELDLRHIMSLDPRGYGVCRILDQASDGNAKASLMAAARTICERLKENSILFIFTGFVLLSHEAAETDGVIGSMLLAKTVIEACGAKPVIICPRECVKAVKHCGNLLGYHVCKDLKTMQERPLCMGVFPFARDPGKAARRAGKILDRLSPDMMIAIEAAGANEKGVYHNAGGLDVTHLEAKSEVLWKLCQGKGIPTLAIGDLGNELGMGSLKEHIIRYVPRTGRGECACGCGGGILSASRADQVITATCSDWGSYALIAAIAYLKEDPELLVQREDYEALLREGVRSGLIDMTGSLLPGIDGFCLGLNAAVLELMCRCVQHAVSHKDEYQQWEQQVLEKGFFGRNREDDRDEQHKGQPAAV